VTRSAGNATVTLTSLIDIAARDAVEVAIGGATNGPAGAQHLMNSTSADSAAVGADYTLVTPVSVRVPTVQLSTRAGGVFRARYIVQFAASASGGLAADADSTAAAQIKLAAPAGTTFPSAAADYVVTNLTQNHRQRLSDCCGGSVAISNSGATVTVTVGTVGLAAGGRIQLLIDGVRNAAAGSRQLAISTTSDTTAKSVGYSLLPAGDLRQLDAERSTGAPGATNVAYRLQFIPSGAGGLVGAPVGSTMKVTTSPTMAGAAGATYRVHFATSAIGGLSALSGSTITLAAPAGTIFPMGGMPYSLLDTTTGAMSGGTGSRPQVVLSNGGATATIAFPYPDVPSGGHFLVTVSGVQNAPTAGKKTLAVTTSSDTVAANGTFTLG
jgi:hypothetical protein